MDFNPDQIESFELPNFTKPSDKDSEEPSDKGSEEPSKKSTEENDSSAEGGEESPVLQVEKNDDSPSETKEGDDQTVDEDESEDLSSDVTVEQKKLGFAPTIFEGQDSSSTKTEIQSISEESQNDEEKLIAISERFDSSSFTAENTLLTNSEEYANTIREGARIYSERLHAEADVKRAEAEQALSDAEAVKKEGEQEKQRLIEEANAQVESIKEVAHQEGVIQGHEVGAKQRYEELAPQAQRMNELLEQLSRLRQIVRFQGEQELLQLAILIAKKVVHEELKINPDVLYDIVRESIKEIEAFGKIRVLVNPGDYDFMRNCQAKLEQYIKEEQTLIIQSNIDAEPGSILIETDETIINYHFESQFAKIEEALSERLSDRQSHMHDVDIDAHDFEPLPESSNGDDTES